MLKKFDELKEIKNSIEELKLKTDRMCDILVYLSDKIESLENSNIKKNDEK